MYRSLDFGKSDLDVGLLTKAAARDAEVLQAILEGIGPETKNHAIREKSSHARALLARERPEVAQPHWTYLLRKLASDSGFTTSCPAAGWRPPSGVRLWSGHGR